MNSYVFLGLFFALGLIYFSIGIRNRKFIKNSSDYFVAGRSLGLLQLSANLIATQLGGGLILGTAASAYSSGLYALLYPLGIALGFVLLGSGIAGRLQACEAITT